MISGWDVEDSLFWGPLSSGLFRGSKEAKEASAESVHFFAGNPTNHELLLKADVVTGLIRLLSAGSMKAKVHATGALLLLLRSNEDLQVDVARRGIIDKFVRLIRTDKGNLPVKENSSEALACVIGNPRVFAMMRESGVLTMMAELLALDAGKPTELAARTLYFMATKNGRGNRPLMDAGIHVTFALFFEADAEGRGVLAEYAAGTLGWLALNPENRLALAKLGILSIAARLLAAGTASPVTTTGCCLILANMWHHCTRSPARSYKEQALRVPGVLPALLACLDSEQPVDTVCNAARAVGCLMETVDVPSTSPLSESVMENVVHGMESMAAPVEDDADQMAKLAVLATATVQAAFPLDPRLQRRTVRTTPTTPGHIYRDALVAMGVLPALVNILLSHKTGGADLERGVIAAADAARLLSNQDTAYRQALCFNRVGGTHRVAIDIAGRNKHSPAERASACRLMTALAADKNLAVLMGQTKGVQTLVRTIDETKGEEGCAVDACEALRVLMAWDPAFVDVALSVDAADLLYSVMEGPVSPPVCTAAAAAFVVAVQYRREVLERFMEKGALKLSAGYAQEPPSDDVQASALDVLAVYARDGFDTKVLHLSGIHKTICDGCGSTAEHVAEAAVGVAHHLLATVHTDDVEIKAFGRLSAHSCFAAVLKGNSRVEARARAAQAIAWMCVVEEFEYRPKFVKFMDVVPATVALLDSMHEFAEAAGTHLLKWLTAGEDTGACAKVVAARGPPLLAKLLDPARPTIVHRQAAQTLRNIASRGGDVLNAVCATAFVVPSVALLSSGDNETIAAVCAVMSYATDLCTPSGIAHNLKRVHKAKALQPLLTLFLTNKDADVLRWACRLTRNLATVYWQHLMQAGAVAALVPVMVNAPDDASMSNAAQALMYVCECSKSSRKEVLSSAFDVLGLVTSKLPGGNEAVVLGLGGLLAPLSDKNPTVAAAVAPSRVPGYMIARLSHRLSAVRAVAVRVLRNLAILPDVAEQLLTRGVATPIVHNLNDDKEPPDTLAYGAECVRRLANGAPQLAYKLVDCVEPLCVLLERGTTACKRGASGALGELSTIPGAHDLMIHAKVIPRAVPLLSCGDIQTEEYSAWVISTVALDDECRTHLHDLGALDAVVDMLPLTPQEVRDWPTQYYPWDPPPEPFRPLTQAMVFRAAGVMRSFTLSHIFHATFLANTKVLPRLTALMQADWDTPFPAVIDAVDDDLIATVQTAAERARLRDEAFKARMEAIKLAAEAIAQIAECKYESVESMEQVAGKLGAVLPAAATLRPRVYDAHPETTRAGCRLLAALRSCYSGDLALYSDGFVQRAAHVLSTTDLPDTATYLCRMVEQYARTDKGREYLGKASIVPGVRRVLTVFGDDGNAMDAATAVVATLGHHDKYAIILVATTEGCKGLLSVLTRAGMPASARLSAAQVLLDAASMTDVRLALFKARPVDVVLEALAAAADSYVQRAYLEHLLKLLSVFSKMAARRLAGLPHVVSLLERYVDPDAADVTADMFGAAKTVLNDIQGVADRAAKVARKEFIENVKAERVAAEEAAEAKAARKAARKAAKKAARRAAKAGAEEEVAAVAAAGVGEEEAAAETERLPVMSPMAVSSPTKPKKRVTFVDGV